MDAIAALPFDAPLPAYARQAEALLAGFRAGEASALATVRRRHPRFLDDRIPWLPKTLTDAEVRGIRFDFRDAELTVARWYDFRDWTSLAAHVAAVTAEGSPVARFEAAVEAVVAGDTAELTVALAADPDLPRARSARITHFDPNVHRAPLLHYVAANGVENYRQKSPPNAVAVATALLRAGAEVDALADLYGGQCTALSMLVSSSPPAEAGVQVALIDTLADFGASLEARGSGAWTSPLITALTFGFADAAAGLIRRGARVETLAAAAGLGRRGEVRWLLPKASPAERHRALALAAQGGHAEVVRLLVEAGENPDRRNPDGFHAHTTPLHQAALRGHAEVVRVLVERGARLDIRDAIYDGTPLGWAEHGGRATIAEYLRAHGG